MAIIITFMLSLSEVTLANMRKPPKNYAHFENLICEKKFGTWRLCSCPLFFSLAIFMRLFLLLVLELLVFAGFFRSTQDTARLTTVHLSKFHDQKFENSTKWLLSPPPIYTPSCFIAYGKVRNRISYILISNEVYRTNDHEATV